MSLITNRSVPVTFRDRGVVGYMDGETFQTDRGPEHVMVMFKGFGVSTGILTFIVAYFRASKIKIFYKSDSIERIYEYDIMDFLTSQKDWIDKSTGKEDPQKFVSLEEQDWDEIKEGVPRYRKMVNESNAI